MIEDFAKYEKRFHYVDSSEEEDQFQQFCQKAQKNTVKNLTISYQQSQTSGNQCQKENRKNQQKKLNKAKSQKTKLCKIGPDNFLLNDNYLNEVEKIIKENHEKITKRTALLVPDTDPQILQNLQKRKKKYGFFLKVLQVDKKYNEKMSKKVNKLKKQNERKKSVIERRNVVKYMKEDENEMRKYVMQKKNKQQIVIDNIQKHAFKLGLQRIRNQYKKIKNEVKQIDKNNDLKAINLQIKQKNQIQELKDQLQRMREMNRVNKIDQAKALKDMKKNVESNKNFLLTKAELSQQRKFII